MADKVKSIDECILTANNLRTTVRKVFQDLAASPGVKREKAESSESSKGENITRLLKKNLTEVHKVLSELDKTCEGLPTSSSGSLSLGNTGLLSLDPIEDKTALYDKVLDTYDWHEKLTSEAQQALSCLKRHHPLHGSDRSSPSPKKAKANSREFLRGEIQKALSESKSLYPCLELSTSMAHGAPVVEVVVPKTLKATMILRNMSEIDQVVIRGIQESKLLDKEESWSQSAHAVFRKITDYATSVVLHHYSPSDPTSQVRGLLKWLNSFQALFSIKCVGCGFHLKEETENFFLPPCWRTFEDLSPYHYQCRP
ncbi:mediator of RNA polymerase II transcription subunit 27 isoform X1 [Pocillopora verrucosa]|uniref:mediator of RNA polymerase II transcription subunit 27 isoform X1 n=1 Tax=Pocillopora verrucosa TaxID=203993 RepID=UPI0033422DF8